MRPDTFLRGKICQKCVSADGGHFAHVMWTGWSHLIWHNVVKVAGNWIKIRSLAYVGTHNRRVKIGWKFPNRFGKIATSPQGGLFYSHCTETQVTTHETWISHQERWLKKCRPRSTFKLLPKWSEWWCSSITADSRAFHVRFMRRFSP